MSAKVETMRCRSARIATYSLCLVAAWAAAASAHGPTKEPAARPVHECGKAQAAARYFIPEHYDPGMGAYREAMPDTDVTHYLLDIEVSNLDPVGNTCVITGSNTMSITSKSAALTEFTFRLREQFTITNAFVNAGTAVTVSQPSTTTRIATLDRTYGLDESFTLTIEYTGNTVSRGFGSIEVQTQGGTDVVATLSEAYFSYTWWPVKDGDTFLPGDNSDKSLVDFMITVPNSFDTAANGLLQGAPQDLGGGRLKYHWKTDYPIAPYLVAFAATEYNAWTQNYVYPTGTMPVDFYIYASNDSPGNRLLWEEVIPMMAVFRPFFGEYPFINEKYGIYNFPFGGGMEHQTMTGQGGFSLRLSAHELAHQWWGDMITCKTWSDIWLNEGFATFSECVWEENKGGSSDMAEYHLCMASERPWNVDNSVYVPADQTADMGRIFSGDFSYRKGAWVLHQLRHVVGDAMLFQILADYRAAYEFKAATTDEFVALASATYGQDLTWFFDQWVYQIGAPAYEYGWDTANVNGQDYLLARIRQTQDVTFPNVFIMPVDLVVTTGAGTETVTVWNDQREQWFAAPVSAPVTSVQFDPDEWILWTAATATTYVGGDLDEDLDVDGTDFTAFEACFTGSGGQLTAGCEPGDFDGDADIDCLDWEAFQAAWTAPGDPPVLPACIGSPPIPAVSAWGLAVMVLLVLSAGTLVLRPKAATAPAWCSVSE